MHATREGAARRESSGEAAPGWRPPVLRILADDLTGALDTAAQFTGLAGPLPILLDEACVRDSAAFDSALRDEPWATARSRGAAHADFLAKADIAYLKVDSLLRGHTIQDIAISFLMGRYRCGILAPAFPAQGRATRRGVQRLRDSTGTWQTVGPPLAEALRGLGVPARLAGSAAEVRGDGLIVCDAETDDDLYAIARAGACLAREAEGRLLWCGSAGLARAVAGREPTAVSPHLQSLLIIVGSVHPQSRAQVTAFAQAHPDLLFEIAETGTPDAGRVSSLLADRGVAMLAFRLAESLDPRSAMRLIRHRLGEVLPALDRPGGLVVSGGETLRTACEALGVGQLIVSGQVRAGFPAAFLVGGIWSGMPLVSKSGAFGDPRTFLDLAAMSAPAGHCPNLEK